MGLTELTDPRAVLSALREYDQLGREAFLAKHGFHPARDYFLVHEGRRYDSKAIVGVAYGFQFPARGPLRAADFSGGETTVKRVLEHLGFEVEGPPPPQPAARVFGDIPAFPAGSHFADRRELGVSGVHRPPQAGISGSAADGADSIVVSGGYEDDEDSGDVIIYTGQGGNDPQTGKQVADQELTRGNMALARSADLGLPVRVIRGFRGNPNHSPAAGYRYDGLFYVESYWHEVGKSGFRIWRFRLVRAPQQALAPTAPSKQGETPVRVEMTIQRIVRSTKVVQRVRELHGCRCQICGELVETPSGPYAEGAHIRALGAPHNGPDAESNVLCLCPNDHVRFDTGAIYLTGHLEIIETATGAGLGKLRTASGHQVAVEHVAYHRAAHEL